MAGSEPDEPVTYSESAEPLVLHHVHGPIMVERLDAATGLPSLDAPAPKVDPPEAGWPEDVCLVDGRPVRPRDPSIRRKVVAANRKRARRLRMRGLLRPSVRRIDTARPRERRSRGTRRTAQASRDGPSDQSEGDPESGSSPSNSRKDKGFFDAWSIADHGIDTVSYAWRPGTQALSAMAAVPSQRLSRRERGESRWATQLVNGIKLGAFPSHGLLVAEGRLAPMLSGDPKDSRLASPGLLVEGASCARRAFERLGVDVRDWRGGAPVGPCRRASLQRPC